MTPVYLPKEDKPEAYYPHVKGCDECDEHGLCPKGATLAKEMIWLKARRGFWR